MSLSINNNSTGMFAHNRLRENTMTFMNSLEKISSGQRINKAADDAAGMVIADNLGSQARSMGQAMQNANDSISMAQIADGALGEATNIIQTIREKAVQASSAAQSPETRAAIQADIDKSLNSLNEIAQNTSYNGQKLLSGSFTNKEFQVGANVGETASLSIDSAEAAKLGDASIGNLSDINVLTFEGAQKAIEIADSALKDLNSTRSDVGSFQNQMTSTISNLSTSQVNTFSAESTIRDLDFAEESMVMSQMDVLTKANTLALAKFNAHKKNILNVLKM